MRGRLITLTFTGLLFGCAVPWQTGSVAGISVASVDLLPARYAGTTYRNGEIALMDDAIVQDDPHRIVIEAEDAFEIEFQPYVGVLKAGRSTKSTELVQVYSRETYEYAPQEDNDASGGKYIDYTHRADYSFTVVEPGEYTLWVRHWVPGKLSWSYNHQMNADLPRRFSLDYPDAKVWYWQKAGTYPLAAGTHNFIVTNLHNGKRLDKMVFSRDDKFQPEGVGPKPSGRRALDDGFVEFAEIAPAGLVRWADLRAGIKYFGGTAVFDVFTDGKWRELPPGNALCKEELDRPTLRLRARLQRSHGRPSPIVRRAEIGFLVSDDVFAEVANDHYRLLFDKAGGRLARIVNRKTGVDLIDPYLACSMVDIFVKKPGEDGRWLEFATAAPAGLAQRNGAIAAVYAFLDGKITVSVTVAATDGPESRWIAKVQNDSEYDVLNVRFPRIENVALGLDPSDDVLLWPNLGGVFYPVPSESGIKEGGYPGHLSLGFVDIFDETGGLALALDDDFIVATRMLCRPDAAKRRVALEFEKEHRIRAGSSHTYNFRIAVHPGDWYAAADLYRASFFRKFKKPAFPEWLVECDAWACGHVGLGGGDRQRWYDEVRSNGWLRALELGVDYVQMWGSLFDGACPSYYLPRKECGGEELFAKFNREFEEAGGNIGYYIHGNAVGPCYILWDKYFRTEWREYPEKVRPPSWEWYKRNRHYPSEKSDVESEKADYLEKIAAWEGGKPFSDHSSGLSTYARMCFHGEFLDWLRFWSERYIFEYNTNTIYFDTMAFGADRAEFSPHFGLHGAGDMAMIKMKFLADNLARMTPKKPGFAQLTEGCGDLWGQYCFSLISGFARHGLSDVFRYTFPEFILFEGHANGLWGEGHKRALSSAFVMGNKFDIITRSDFTDRILALRQEISPILAHARFMGGIGIDRSESGVLAKGFTIDRDGTRGFLVTVWNEKNVTGSTVSAALDVYGDAAEYWLFEIGAAPRRIQPVIGDGTVTFGVPAGVNSALVALQSCAAAQAVSVVNRFDGKYVISRLFNFTGKPLDVAVEYAAEGVRFREQKIARTLAPGMNVIKVAPELPAGMNVAALLKIAVSWPGRTRRFLSMVGPLVEDGGFEYYKDFAAREDVKYEGGFSHQLGKEPQSYGLNPAYAVPVNYLRDGGYVNRQIVTYPQYRYRASVAVKGGPVAVFLLWDKLFSDNPKRIDLKKVRTDRGWDIYEAEFDGAGRVNFMLHAAKEDKVLADALKIEIVAEK